MAIRSAFRHRTAFLTSFCLFACSQFGIMLVQSFQCIEHNNLQTVILHGISVHSSSSTIQNYHHQRPMRLRSLVLVGNYETRTLQLPAVASKDVLAPTRHSPDVHGELLSPSTSATFPTHNRSNSKFSRKRGNRSSSPSKTRQEITTTKVINNRHSSGDWLYNLWTIPRSSVLKEILNPVLTLAGWATSIAILHRGLMLSPGHVMWASRMCLPNAAHSFLVSSLGLLLVFRTNSAYQRFVEARKIWEQIHTVSRNLTRLTMLYRAEVGTERLNRIQNLIASFPYLLRHHVRSSCLCRKDDDEIPPEFQLVLHDPALQRVDSRYEGDKSAGGATRVTTKMGVRECFVDRRDLPWNLLDDAKNHDNLSSIENGRRLPGTAATILERVARATNRPLWVCDRLGKEVMGIPYGPNYSSRERLAILSSIDELSKAVGECERIHQTTVPLNYARHALRSLTIWLFSLPFCLVEEFGLLTGPVTALIAWLLFGVYQIGHSIEDPFQGTLRLSILCDAIHKDVLLTDGDSESSSSLSSIRASAFDMDCDTPHHHYLENSMEARTLFPSTQPAHEEAVIWRVLRPDLTSCTTYQNPSLTS